MFTIPSVALTDLSQQALTRHLDEAREAYRAQFSAATEARNAGTLTSAMVDDLGTLSAWISDARAQLATFTATPATVDPATSEPTGDDPATRLDTFSANTDPKPATDPAPGIADAAARTGAPSVTDTRTSESREAGYLTASSSVAGFASGQRLTLEQAGQMLHRRITALLGAKQDRAEALFTLNRAENPFVVDRSNNDLAVLDAVCDDARLPGGSLMAGFANQTSLTASAGWCAPSEIDWTIRTSYSGDGTLSVPTVSAPRGGLRTFAELAFTTVNGGYTGTNFWNLTEAQVAAGVPKTFVEINCPTDTDYRLNADGLGVIGNLLALRGFPEYCSKFIAGAQVALSHFETRVQIAAIVAGATGVTLTGNHPWSSDGTVFTQTIAAVDMAATDIRSAKRMARNATMEVVLPEWWIADARADLMRRVSNTNDIVWADTMIIAAFTRINVVPQFVKNYQDAYATVAGAVGVFATPITQFPISLNFLIYPQGAWVLAQNPIIDLSTVYDATRLANNQDLELFHEVGWAMIPRLTGTREYTINICPSGAVGATHTITCAT